MKVYTKIFSNPEIKTMSYVATITPYKGIQVNTTPFMGMPGSSEILQELPSRVFGNEKTEGWILTIANDMYFCSNSETDLLLLWELVFERISKNG